MNRRIFGLYICMLVVTGIYAAASQGETELSSPKAYTPKKGSPERKMIMNALRYEVEKMRGLKVVFVVNHLKVKDGWAWIETLPQSPDGKSKYEDVSALLKRGDKCWSVVAIPEFAECVSADDPVSCWKKKDQLFRKNVSLDPFFVPGEIFLK